LQVEIFIFCKSNRAVRQAAITSYSL